MAPLRRFQHRSQPKRLTSWSVGAESALVSLTSTGSALWLTGVVPAQSGLTIVRTRGEFLAYLTAASGVNNGFTGAVGLGIVSTEAFAAGVASVPTPLSDSDWDGWLWHSFFHLMSGAIMDGTAAADTNLENTVQVRLPIDSKAMRKLPDGWTVIGVVQATEIGTASMSFFGNSRMLVKL